MNTYQRQLRDKTFKQLSTQGVGTIKESKNHQTAGVFFTKTEILIYYPSNG